MNEWTNKPRNEWTNEWKKKKVDEVMIERLNDWMDVRRDEQVKDKRLFPCNVSLLDAYSSEDGSGARLKKKYIYLDTPTTSIVYIFPVSAMLKQAPSLLK